MFLRLHVFALTSPCYYLLRYHNHLLFQGPYYTFIVLTAYMRVYKCRAHKFHRRCCHLYFGSHPILHSQLIFFGSCCCFFLGWIRRLRRSLMCASLSFSYLNIVDWSCALRQQYSAYLAEAADFRCHGCLQIDLIDR